MPLKSQRKKMVDLPTTAIRSQSFTLLREIPHLSQKMLRSRSIVLNLSRSIASLALPLSLLHMM